MKLLRTRDDLGELDALRGGDPLVFVPTMGALHSGHLSLVRRAAQRGPVVVSIFVNPNQFGQGEDFEAYPRRLEEDLELLAPLAPAAVFAPDRETIYGRGDGVTVQPGRYATGLCGELRPGHFAGVLTVVAKLFGLVQPAVAIFGRKDAQQCLVIAEMVRDLGLPWSIEDAPTVREDDGLAKSSRNAYLDEADRRRATCLWAALTAAHGALAAGDRDGDTIRALMVEALGPADSVDYAVLRRIDNWTDPVTAEGHLLLAVAARVGPARLIDNLVLDIDGATVCETSLLGGQDTDAGRDDGR